MIPVKGAFFNRAKPTFNPSDKGSGITLSANNTTAACSGAAYTVRASYPLVYSGGFYRSGGLWYFEFPILAATTLAVVGIADNGAINLSTFLGADSHGWGLYKSAGGATIGIHVSTAGLGGSGFTTGDTVGFAADLTNQFLYAHINGVWVNGGVPTSGLSGTGHIFAGPFGSICPAFGANAAATVSLNCGQSAFKYPVPNGYRAFANM